MNDRNAARLTGVLFIVATATNLLGAAVRPGLAGPDSLARVAGEPERVAAGALLLIIAAFACAGIAVAMYPILRRMDPGLALGSVVFRTVEAVMYLVAIACLLSLGTVGGASLTASATETGVSAAIGGLLLSLRDDAALVGVFAFCLGASLYYVAFFRSRVVPRWLSGWGILAIGVLAAMAGLALLRDVPVTSYPLLGIPIFLQEIVLAVWLIVKGFSPVGRTASAPVLPVVLPAAAPVTAR
jgi:hypothetical protein